MKLCIHRGTHQIGGIAAEISTASTRILIDMGDELSLDPNFVSAPLNIPGVTDGNGYCDAVLFTHYHGDHTGQMLRIRPEIPLYAGALAKDIMLQSAEHGGHKDDALSARMQTIQTFSPGEPFLIGDIQITPFCIDHSAADSYRCCRLRCPDSPAQTRTGSQGTGKSHPYSGLPLQSHAPNGTGL